MKKRRAMSPWIWIPLAAGAALALVLALLLPADKVTQGSDELLESLYQEIIPAADTKTNYGIPLSWDNARTFADWYYDIRLAPDEVIQLQRALAPVATPCCDDTTVVRCCCEKSGKICNLVRSARGLAAWLIQKKGFSVEETREAVVQWLKFAHRDYYVAKALAERGISPSRYGLTTRGTCYRQQCEIPLRKGGCGGMSSGVRI